VNFAFGAETAPEEYQQWESQDVANLFCLDYNFFNSKQVFIIAKNLVA